MRFRSFICWTIFATIFFISCGPSTEGPISADPEHPEGSSEIMLNLRPAITEPKVTLVEFLIDNSTSVESECGDLGVRRYDFVNFMLRIFQTIPQPLSQNLFVGAGSFGNGAENYIRIISPERFSSSFPPITEPVNTGDDQKFSDGIQRAADDMYTQLAEKRYLVIITDGKFSSASDNAFSVQEKLAKITTNENFSVLVGLICPENLAIQNDISIWRDRIDGINGVVDVFSSVEEVSRKLLNDLNSFLPGSIIKSSENYLDPLIIPGSYTSSYSHYWNYNINNSVLTITDTTTDESWDVSNLQYKQSLRPVDGCVQHNFSIPNPGSHWLLFIQARTFQELRLIMTTNTGRLEVVNNNPLIFNLEINDTLLPDYDLRNWKDCFLVDLAGPNGDPLNGFVTPISYDGINYMQLDNVFENLYGQVEWNPPQFSSPEEVEIKINFKAKDGNGPVWDGVYNLPIKFEAIFLPQTSLIDDNPDTIERNITFTNISSQPTIFIVSDLNHDKLMEIRNGSESQRKFQQIDYIVNQEEASEVVFSEPCLPSENISNEAYICMMYHAGDTLTFTYTLQTFKHIVEDYNFNRLFFVWEESNVSKAKVWECRIEFVMVECDGDIPMPDIVHK